MLPCKTLLWLTAAWLLACAPLAHAEKIKPIANEEQGVLLPPGMAELMEEANAGDAEAAKTVGVQYEMGLSVVQDYDKALEWYLKAVKLGSVEALYHIGLMHEGGAGRPRGSTEALRWYKQAAAKGHGGAKTRIKIINETAATVSP